MSILWASFWSSSWIHTGAFLHRTAAISATCWFAVAASTETAEAGPAPAPALQRIDHYTYEVKHEVAWQSLGDDVRYETQQAWTMGLARAGQDIIATVYSINAVHRGPDAEYRLQAPVNPDDATDEVPARDAILGPLAAWVDVPVRISLDENGRVSTVDGAALRQAWQETLPITAQIPDAPQLTDEALAQWWQELFLTPPMGENAEINETIILPAPLKGQAQRQWNGNSYELSQDPEQPITLQLYRRPNEVLLSVNSLSGSGTVTMHDNYLIDIRDGTLNYTLSGTAMTQPVQQIHSIRWRWRRTPIETLQQATQALDDEPGRRGR